MEAHPVDVWQTEGNVTENINVFEPKDFQQRCEVAGQCITKLSIRIPAVIDDMENTTQTGYAAHPDRLYIIDREGRVAYKGRPGPFGFKSAEMAASLRKLLAAAPAQAALAK